MCLALASAVAHPRVLTCSWLARTLTTLLRQPSRRLPVRCGMPARPTPAVPAPSRPQRAFLRSNECSSRSSGSRSTRGTSSVSSRRSMNEMARSLPHTFYGACALALLIAFVSRLCKLVIGLPLCCKFRCWQSLFGCRQAAGAGGSAAWSRAPKARSPELMPSHQVFVKGEQRMA